MRKILSMTSAMLVLFAISFSILAASAQTNPTINIKERLPDGEYILSIDGIEQRTITAAHAREIVESKAELDRLRRVQPLYAGQITQLKLAVELAKKDAQLATTQAALERERAEKFQALFKGEQALRLQAEKLAPRGSVSRFFDNPYVQVAVKVGVPVVQSYLTARRE